MNYLRSLLLSFILALPPAAMAQDADGEDRERRLSRIKVTALPPHMGTAYANAFTKRPQDFERPGFKSIEIRFFPVTIDESGAAIPDTVDTRKYTISTRIPARAEGVEFTDSVRDFYTQDIALPSGYYVVSEIAFRRQLGETASDAVYCLAKGSLLFRIRGRDTLFLGRLNISYPAQSDLTDSQFSPLENMGENLQKMKGWRWTTMNLLGPDLSTTTFDPALSCSPGSTIVKAWRDEQTGRAYSPAP